MSELKRQRQLIDELERIWTAFDDLPASKRLACFLAVAHTMADGDFSPEALDEIIRYSAQG